MVAGDGKCVLVSKRSYERHLSDPTQLTLSVHVNGVHPELTVLVEHFQVRT